MKNLLPICCVLWFMAATPALRAGDPPSTPATGPVRGKDVLVIKDSKDAQTFDADGQDVTVNGSHNKVTIKGTCHALTVSGSANAVTVSAVASIALSGTGNEVVWSKAVGGETPQITDVGQTNKVTHAAAKAE